MSAMPNAIRALKFSLHTNHASSAVRTPSRFKSNEELDAGVAANPHISSTGPTIPPMTIAPISQGKSFRVRAASREPTTFMRERMK